MWERLLQKSTLLSDQTPNGIVSKWWKSCMDQEMKQMDLF